MTWLLTGLIVGVSLGAFSAGWVVDWRGDALAGFHVALAAALAVLAITLYGHRNVLRSAAPRHHKIG